MTVSPNPSHTFGRVLYRFLVGRPLDGIRRTDGGYLRRGRAIHGYASSWARRPGWHRQAWRLGILAGAGGSAYAWHTFPQVTAAAGLLLVAYGLRRLRRWWRWRRFNAIYLKPTKAALTLALGNAPVQLRVSPELGTLVARLAKPMSPAEEALRRWYGLHVEPVLRWLPDHVMRGWWGVGRLTSPATRRLHVLRRPRPDDAGPRIDLATQVPYVTSDDRTMVGAIVAAKIPAGEMNDPRWDQVGTQVNAVWTVRRRPPAHVGYEALKARFGNLKDHELFAGLGVGEKPVIIDLHLDSPHIAESAGTGAGKSVLVQLLAVQVLARGGLVTLLDLKGSHRWALNMPGVDYCTRAAQMHDALVRLAEVADQRNQDSLHEAEGWDPGPRILVVAEELNATMALLKAYWAQVRPPGGPKTSPAIEGLRFLLYTGRAAKMHVLGVAQMLTALATGGPEGRENFGVRCLARYTRNAWQMLVPEAAMPRASRTLGRWQVVVAGQVTETQVCYLSAQEARIFVHRWRPTDVHMNGANAGVHEDIPAQTPIKGLRSPVHMGADPLTLQDSIDEGVCPWALAAVQKRLQRARAAGRATPQSVGKRQRADLYERAALVAWFESELVP